MKKKMKRRWMEQKGLEERLGLAPLNRRRVNGTYGGEVRRLRIGDRKMTYDPHDSRKKIGRAHV